MNTAALIFDFDGTLHDTMIVYRTALQDGYDWLVGRGRAVPRTLTEDDIRENIGLTAEEAWGRMCPEISWAVAEPAAARVAQNLSELIDRGEAALYPGVPAMLSNLKRQGHTMILLSNCRNDYCTAARRAFGLDTWFSRYYTAEQFGDAPKEVIFQTIAREVVGPYIAVGDRYKDLALARAHDLPSIGCLYGFGSREELARATCLAWSPAEIPNLVNKIASRFGDNF